ncbi:MAG: hypothetical protein M0Q12_01150 [Synergistaceae bacterium]|jgi:hypothetical protein|nr:hypothetical protein [Synergistaceae bacterium]
MSDSMQKILANIRRDIKKPKVKVSELQEDEQHIKLDSAIASNRFESLGRGLYREASTMQKIGGVWAVKEFENPETHQQEKWLVSYQDSDDDIALKVANEVLIKTAELDDAGLGVGKVIVRLHVDSATDAPTVTDPFDITSMLESGDFKDTIVEFDDGSSTMAGAISGQTFDVTGGGRVTVASKYSVASLSKDADLRTKENRGYRHKYADPWTIKYITMEGSEDHITDPVEIKEILSSIENDPIIHFYNDDACKASSLSGQVILVDLPENNRITIASLNKTAADKIPDPKDIPIAQGIKSKNITMDETGAGGTAKVTIEFTDPAKGLDFYKNNVGGGNEKPAEAPKEEAPKEEAKEPEGGPKAQAPVPEVPQVPAPNSGGMGGLAPMSSVQNYTRGGKQNIMITLEKVATDYMSGEGRIDNRIIKHRDKGSYPKPVLPHELDISRFKTKEWPESVKRDEEALDDNIPISERGIKDKLPKSVVIPDVEDLLEDDEDAYSFINEDGQKVTLSWKKRLQVGDTFLRPDTGVEARVAGYKEVSYADNDDIIAVLAADEGVDLPFHRSRVDFKGNQHYYDNKGEYHNSEGPAFVGYDGSQQYFKHGKFHNDKGPAVVSPDGSVKYFIDGECMTEAEFVQRTKAPVEQLAADIINTHPCPGCKKLIEWKDDLNDMCPKCGCKYHSVDQKSDINIMATTQSIADMVSTETSIEGITEAMINEGVIIEKEHTTDDKVARQIAIDHLAEDRDYYKKLKKVEALNFGTEAEPDVEVPTKVDPDVETPEKITPVEPNRSPFRGPQRAPEYLPGPKAIGKV